MSKQPFIDPQNTEDIADKINNWHNLRQISSLRDSLEWAYFPNIYSVKFENMRTGSSMISLSNNEIVGYQKISMMLNFPGILKGLLMPGSLHYQIRGANFVIAIPTILNDGVRISWDWSQQ